MRNPLGFWKWGKKEGSKTSDPKAGKKGETSMVDSLHQARGWMLENGVLERGERITNGGGQKGYLEG